MNKNSPYVLVAICASKIFKGRAVIMATKSFVTEFKFNQNSGFKLLNAIENSKKIDRKLIQRVDNVTNRDEINKLMKSVLGED